MQSSQACARVSSRVPVHARFQEPRKSAGTAARCLSQTLARGHRSQSPPEAVRGARHATLRLDCPAPLRLDRSLSPLVGGSGDPGGSGWLWWKPPWTSCLRHRPALPSAASSQGLLRISWLASAFGHLVASAVRLLTLIAQAPALGVHSKTAKQMVY